MPSIPVWRGSSAITECPDSPVITVTKDGFSAVSTYSGPYAACVAAMPGRLSKVGGLSSSLLADTIEVKKLAGGKGLLTITFNSSPSPSPDSNTSIHEIEWAEVQRPLAQHKRFQSGGANPLDDGDWTDIDGWKAEQNQSLRKDFKYKHADGANFSGAIITLGDGAIEFCQKLLRGQDSYNEYTPIARLTTCTLGRPITGHCGTINNSPPVEGIPDSYKWLKTADRACKRSRTWERVQEWTGTWWWDPDIYAS